MKFKNVVLVYDDDEKRIYEMNEDTSIGVDAKKRIYEMNEDTSIEKILETFSDKNYKKIFMYSEDNEYYFISKKNIEESINRWLSFGLYDSRHKIIQYSEAVITDIDKNIDKNLKLYEDIENIYYNQRQSNEIIAILRRKK